MEKKMIFRLIHVTLWLVLQIYSTSLFADKTIKIALAIPLTGNYISYGHQLLAGTSQAAKDLNKQGGFLGIPIEIVPYDDKNDPTIAANLAKKLAKEPSIHAVIGHTTSATTLAALEHYAKAKKLMITATATNPKITQAGYQTVFRCSGKDEQQSTIIAKFLVKKLNAKKIAIIYTDDLYSKDLADHVAVDLVALKSQLGLYYNVPLENKDFTKVITKCKELAIDAIFMAGFYPEVGELAKEMYAHKLQLPLLTGDSIALNAFITATGGRYAAAAVMMSFGQDGRYVKSSSAVIKAMLNEHLEINGYTLYAYSAVQVIVAAMQATKSTDGVKLSNWLHCHSVPTVLGDKTWDTNGDLMNANYKIYIWGKDGKYKPLG